MKRITILLCSICMSLICGELFVRWYAPQQVYKTGHTSESCYQTDPVLYTTLKPNSQCKSSSMTHPADVFINTLGFRGTSEQIKEKTSEKKRILFVGDSYTFGHGVTADESYPFVVQSYIERSRPIEVFNAGIPGVGLDWYYLYIKEKAFTFQPDLIVVGMYLGNDLFDHEYFDTTKRDAQGLPIALGTSHEYVDYDNTRRASDTPWQYTIPWVRSSHLFILIANRINPPNSPKQFYSMNGSGCYLKPDCTQADVDIAKAETLINAMTTLANEHNTPILFVLLPWEAQLPRSQNAASGGYLIAATTKQRHAISDKIGAVIKRANAPYIDLLDGFDAYQGSEAVYTPIDYHWNKTGHRIAGEFLAPTIEAMLFPSSVPTTSGMGQPQ